MTPRKLLAFADDRKASANRKPGRACRLLGEELVVCPLDDFMSEHAPALKKGDLNDHRLRSSLLIPALQRQRRFVANPAWAAGAGRPST